MSDEQKKEEPQGCLTLVVLFMSVALVLLVLMCYHKVSFSGLIPKPTTEQTGETTDVATPDQKPEQTTEPSQNTQTTEPAPTTEPTQETEPAQTTPPETTSAEQEPAVITDDEDLLQDVAATEPGEAQRNYLVVIDAGHQAQGNSEKEPIGPGATEKKAKVSSGTQGVATGLEEYELNLQVAKKLQTILESRGYQVVMVRTDHNVNLSNAERAEIANGLEADAFIRIHANGDSNADTQGIMTLCQTETNPYNGELYAQCKELARCVLEETVAATGGQKQFVWETDTMSGINWCKVPVTIVEMGYMSNPEEDKLMATEDYQQKLAEGMANGIDRYFAD